MSVDVSVSRHTQLQQRVLVANVFEISVIDAQLPIVEKLNNTYRYIVVRVVNVKKYNDNKLVLTYPPVVHMSHKKYTSERCAYDFLFVFHSNWPHIVKFPK